MKILYSLTRSRNIEKSPYCEKRVQIATKKLLLFCSFSKEQAESAYVIPTKEKQTYYLIQKQINNSEKVKFQWAKTY